MTSVEGFQRAPKGSEPNRAILFAASLLPVLVWWVFYPGYYGADDAYIHKAVVENFVDGRGWGVNPGQNVGLSTAPGFTLLMALVDLLPGDLLLKGSLVTQAAAVGGCFLAGLAAHRMAGRAVAGYAACLLAATNLSLWRWTGTFMETTIAHFGVILVVYLFARLQFGRRADRASAADHFGLGLVCGGLALFRPELGAVPFLLLAAMAVVPASALAARWVALMAGAAIVAVAYGIFAISTWGGLVPTTFAAKTAQSFSLFNPKITMQFAAVLASSCLGAVVIVAALVLRLRVSDRHIWKVLFLPLLVPAFGFAFYYLETEGVQSAGRYFLPFIAPLPIAAGVIMAASGTTATLVFAAPALQALVSAAMLFIYVDPVLSAMKDGYVTSMKGAVAKLGEVCRPGDTVLIAYDLGVIADNNDSTCVIADGGALASPELNGMPLDGMLRVTGARFLVESLSSVEGGSDSWLGERGIKMTEIYASRFPSHGITEPDRDYVVRLYELEAR